MKLEEIDNIFKRQEHQFEKMPSTALWEKLDAQLSETPPVKSLWRPYRAVAAIALLLLTAIPIVWLSMPNAPNEQMAMQGKSLNQMKSSDIELEDESAEAEILELKKSVKSSEKDKAEFVEKEIRVNNQADTDKALENKALESSKKATKPTQKEATISKERLNVGKEKLAESSPKNTPQPIYKLPEKEASLSPPPPPSSATAKDKRTNGLASNEEEEEKSYEMIVEEKEDYAEPTVIDQRILEVSRYEIALNYPAYTPSPAPSMPSFSDAPTETESKKARAKRSKKPAGTEAIKTTANNWFTGAWLYKKDNFRLEEHWQKVGAKQWEGKTFSFVNGQRLLTELMWVEEKNGILVYMIRDLETNQRVAFNLVEQTPTTWIFQNPSHDFPRQIIYTKVNDKQLNLNFSNVQQQGSLNLYKN